MPPEQQVTDFLRSSLRSVWTLEALLLMANDPARCWPAGELVSTLRASDLVVSRAIDELGAAGLIVPEKQDCVRYCPATADLEALVTAARALYAKSPDLVRRAIIGGRDTSLTAFSNAFKLRNRDS